MENKRIKPELVISDEKEIIRELSEAVLGAVELTAREAFYTIHDEYEYEDRLHVFNSYVNLFEELKEISPAHAITLIDIILIDHGYSFIPEQLRVLCRRNIDAIDRFNDSFKKCAIEAFMDELDMADAEYEDEFEDEEDSSECDCGSCDSCKCEHECEGGCQCEKIDFTFKVGNQIAEGTLRPCECKCCDDKGCDEDEYVIISGSMEPELPVGSVCLVDCQQKEPEVGDIISYKAKDTIITHRVIEKTDDGYTTKGDSNSVADPGIVKPKQIFGTVICSIPKVGYAAMFMRTLKGIVLIAIGTVCFGSQVQICV